MHLQDLIQPISTDEFFARYWEREVLHLHGNGPGRLSGLFGLEDLDYLLGYLAPESMIRIADCRRQGGTALSRLEAGIVHLGRAYESFYEGNTLVVDGLHRLWKPVSHLCQKLLLETGMQTQANLYVTPRGGAGFGCHWDGHDVLVLQISGTKTWRIYESGPVLPRPASVGDAFDKRDLPSRKVTLNPGDILYVPRGRPHEASANDEASVHITVGLLATTWEDLLLACVRAVADRREEVRRSLPRTWTSRGDDITGARDLRLQVLNELLSEQNLEDAVDLLSAQLMQNAPCLPDGHFMQIDLVDRIGLETMVTKRAGEMVRVSRGDEGAKLSFPGGFVAGPGKLLWAFQFMADSHRFRVRDIPGWYSDEERLMLARLLVRKGFLRILSLGSMAPRPEEKDVTAYAIAPTGDSAD